MSMRGIWNGGFDLRVSVSLRGRNEIRYVQIDSEKRRIYAVDNLKACIGVLGDALVVFHAKCDALLPCVVARLFQCLNSPLNALLNSRSSGQLASEDTQVRGT